MLLHRYGLIVLATVLAASVPGVPRPGVRADAAAQPVVRADAAAQPVVRADVAPRARPVLRYAFPVRGRVSYARQHSLYPATDIFAPCGRRIVSPVDGTVLEVNRKDRFRKSHPQGAWKGGRFVSIRGRDGVRHYGAHLQSISRTVRRGARVRAGQTIGTVGRTGNSSGICHLHYALSPVCAERGDWWLRRGVVYPWPFLDKWRAGHPADPRAAVARWQRVHGCPATP